MQTRRQFLSHAAGAVALPALTAINTGAAQQRPLNILWITCEDMSPHLGCFGDKEARTPNLDRLASEGVRYTNVFSVAGVCAPSRSCIITGMYPTTLGTCHMRCNHPPPETMRCFPAYLRDTGYYCTNNVKTDYQFPVPPDAWNDNSKTAHWRNRSNTDQPFFAVFNFTTTHESQIGNLGALPDDLAKRLEGKLHDPARATLPPYYPDTELTRRHWAHYYDLISAMDLQAGDILAQLEADGLAENTVVFFFSDHGAGLPRAKRWMYDSGLHVPMIVRWPGKLEPGTQRDRLVSFLDLAPTVLSLAGVEKPSHMQGSAFLGPADAAPRKYVFGARDRMDERYDIIRAVRTSRYKYNRNYQPYKPYAQYVSYCESWPVMQEWRRCQAAGTLNEQQSLFFQHRKPLEELYDTHTDPHELRNIVNDPAHTAILTELRAALETWHRETNDLGFIPETELDKWVPANRTGSKTSAQAPYVVPENWTKNVFGISPDQLIANLNDTDVLTRARAAATIALASDAVASLMAQALLDPEPSVAYWAATGLGRCVETRKDVDDALLSTLEHQSACVRLAAADALCKRGYPRQAVPVLLAGLQAAEPFVRIQAALALDDLEPKPDEVRDAFTKALNDTDKYVPDVARHALNLPAQR